MQTCRVKFFVSFSGYDSLILCYLAASGQDECNQQNMTSEPVTNSVPSVISMPATTATAQSDFEVPCQNSSGGDPSPTATNLTSGLIEPVNTSDTRRVQATAAAAECSLSPKEVLSSSPAIQSTVHSPAVRPVDLSPLPVMKIDKQKQRKSRCSQASDLTSTPYKKLLESRPANVKRKKSVSRSLAGEMSKKIKSEVKGSKKKDICGIPVKPVSAETVKGNSAENNESETPKTFSIGLWVLVKYDIAKTEKCYIGRITDKVQDVEDRWEVHFLKRSNRCSSTFTDALTGDQASDEVDESDIVVRLPDPKVRRGLHSFDYDFDRYNMGN